MQRRATSCSYPGTRSANPRKSNNGRKTGDERGRPVLSPGGREATGTDGEGQRTSPDILKVSTGAEDPTWRMPPKRGNLRGSNGVPYRVRGDDAGVRGREDVLNPRPPFRYPHPIIGRGGGVGVSLPRRELRPAELRRRPDRGGQ